MQAATEPESWGILNRKDWMTRDWRHRMHTALTETVASVASFRIKST